jgi:hypothetical protein
VGLTSDPNSPLFTPNLPSVTENGTFQALLQVTNQTTGATDTYYVRLDIDTAVPEISAGSMASAVTVLAGAVLLLRGRRRRSAAA